jgi:Uncharacterised nucleotidyltransferase
MARERPAESSGGMLLLRTLRFRSTEPPEVLRRAWATAPTHRLQMLIHLERCHTWLLRRLHELEAGEQIGPFVTWLSSQARAGAARDLLIEARALELAHWLSRRGVPFVFLKGVARRLMAESYPGITLRATTDVDVLVRETDASGIWEALRAEGYHTATAPEKTPTGHYHLVPLAHRDGVAVELHISTGPGLAPAEAWHRATGEGARVEREGLHLTLPSATEMLWQTVTHAETDGSGGYDLRHFQDAAVFLAMGTLNWPVLHGRFATPEIRHAPRMKGWLAGAAWLAGGAEVPEGLRAGRWAFDLPRAMRWRYLACCAAVGRPRLLEKLVDEATRAEARLPRAGTRPGIPLLPGTRRRIATTLARGGYLAWRAVAG